MERRIEILRELANQVNAWDGSLDHLDVQDFDEDFFRTYFEGNPMDAARATFFGEIESWMDAYIMFNGYGNLKSISEWEYEKMLEESEDEIIEYATDIEDDYIKELLVEYKEITDGE